MHRGYRYVLSTPDEMEPMVRFDPTYTIFPLRRFGSRNISKCPNSERKLKSSFGPTGEGVGFDCFAAGPLEIRGEDAIGRPRRPGGSGSRLLCTSASGDNNSVCDAALMMMTCPMGSCKQLRPRGEGPKRRRESSGKKESLGLRWVDPDFPASPRYMRVIVNTYEYWRRRFIPVCGN